MPPRDVLDSLWAEVRTDRSPVQTAIAAPPIPYRNAPRNRPPPRQMRPVEQRAMDPNAGVRRQAMGQIERRGAADLATMPRTPRGNQFAEAGSMALEATGLPQVRRGAETLGDVAQAPYQPNAPMRALGGFGELGMGAAGALSFGEFAAMRPRGRVQAPPRLPDPAEPMPRMTPPPREIAPNGMTIRPSEPFRNSLRGGSDDLAEAARPTQTPDAGGGRGGNAYLDDLRAQGFDVETPLYHGSPTPIDGLSGRAFVSHSPTVGSTFAEAPRTRLGQDAAGENVLPMYGRAGRQLQIDPSDMSVPEFEAALAKAQADGYASVRIGGRHDETIYFDAANDLRPMYGRAPATPDVGSAGAPNAPARSPSGPPRT